MDLIQVNLLDLQLRDREKTIIKLNANINDMHRAVFPIKVMKTAFQQEDITDSVVIGFTMLQKLKEIQSHFTAIGMIGYQQRLDTLHTNT